ncbi:hypothetical protein JY402_08815 [Fusobacterium polymorphum]|nr:hypothetical protein [Fusobacterium nucleatum]MCG6837966.1 hypothetical protein [Fusobacterium nucleatum]QYR60213.1 hypothetical protein JY397_06290 [Fusobacterium polymorphum]QYR62489.1 hypothetical protein JY402_08815 [Fusobacterium polymorphum]
MLKIKDSYNEESFEELIGEIEGELKEDIENINFFLKNSQNEYFIKLENKELSLIRKSENKLDINLKFNGEKNNFFYEIENFKQNFLVLGEKYSYNIKNKIFQFSYILFDENHNEINKIRISIENV